MKPGDKVMCVDVNWEHVGEWSGLYHPGLGLIYTIKRAYRDREDDGRPTVTLVEITNPLWRDGEESGFYQFHFRKLDDIPDKVPTLALQAEGA